jgi:hypothetical protein
LGLLNPWKRQCFRQEQEVYHSLYKDKLEGLIKEALAERLPELQNIPNGSEGEDNSDASGNESSKGKCVEASSLKKIRKLCMKIRHEVRANAWENETAEVRRQVKNEMAREREEVTEIKGDKSKVGLE